MKETMNIISYDHEFPHAQRAVGIGHDFVTLVELDERVRRKADGKLAEYELTHKWLKKPCTTDDDQAWLSAIGTRRGYMRRIEVEPLILNNPACEKRFISSLDCPKKEKLFH